MALIEQTDDAAFLYLAAGDNIAVATRQLDSGSIVEIEGVAIGLKSRVDVGHKFAVRAIRAGEQVVKYGAPIGSASCDIAPGDYVHIHNLQSDYLPSYTLAPVEDTE